MQTQFSILHNMWVNTCLKQEILMWHNGSLILTSKAPENVTLCNLFEVPYQQMHVNKIKHIGVYDAIYPITQKALWVYHNQPIKWIDNYEIALLATIPFIYEKFTSQECHIITAHHDLLDKSLIFPELRLLHGLSLYPTLEPQKQHGNYPVLNQVYIKHGLDFHPDLKHIFETREHLEVVEILVSCLEYGLWPSSDDIMHLHSMKDNQQCMREYVYQCISALSVRDIPMENECAIMIP